MTSKNLYLKMIVENLKKRSWNIWLISLFYFFFLLIPSIIGITNEISKESLAEYYINIVANPFLIVEVLVFSVIIAISGFSYLYKKTSTDFYHSLPIKREVLYSVNVVSAYIIFFLPFIIISLLSTTLIYISTASTGLYLELGFRILRTFIYFSFAYSTVLFALMLTGSAFTTILMSSLLFFYLPATILLARGYVEEFFTSINVKEIDIIKYIYRVPSALLMIKNNYNTKFNIILCIILSLVFFVLAIILYKKRASEKSQNAIVFSQLKAPLKILINISFSLFVGLVWYVILNRNIAWLVFGTISSLLISNAVAEIIYTGDFKKAFNNKRHLIIEVLILCIVFSIFKLDILGVDRYFPSDKIVKMKIESYFIDVNSSRYRTKHSVGIDAFGKKDIIEVEEDIRAFIEDKGLIKDFAMFANANKKHYKEKFDFLGNVSEYKVIYIDDKGKEIKRRYFLEDKIALEILDLIYTKKEYKKSLYDIFDKDSKEIKSVDFKLLISNKGEHIEDKDKVDKLFESYKKDLMEFSLLSRENAKFISVIRFNDENIQEVLDFNKDKALEDLSYKKDYYYVNRFNKIGFYPIFSSFENTLKTLEELGIKINNFPSVEEISSIDLSLAYRYSDERKIMINNSEDIQDILDKIIIINSDYYTLNQYIRSDDFSEFEIRINLKNGASYFSEDTLYVAFRKDAYPSSLKGYIENER